MKVLKKTLVEVEEEPVIPSKVEFGVTLPERNRVRIPGRWTAIYAIVDQMANDFKTLKKSQWVALTFPTKEIAMLAQSAAVAHSINLVRSPNGMRTKLFPTLGEWTVYLRFFSYAQGFRGMPSEEDLKKFS